MDAVRLGERLGLGEICIWSSFAGQPGRDTDAASCCRQLAAQMVGARRDRRRWGVSVAIMCCPTSAYEKMENRASATAVYARRYGT